MIGRSLTHCVIEEFADDDEIGVRCAMRHHDGDALGAMDTMAADPVHGNDAEQRGGDESKAIGLHQ